MRITPFQNFYRTMQRWHPDVLFYGDETRHEIALTFDDGPHPRDTPHVLDVLAKHNIQATFFLVGKYVEKYPHIVKQIHENGHQIGIHCYRHILFPMEHPLILRAQLMRVKLVTAKTCGISLNAPWYVRPPYGFFTKRILSVLNESNFHLVLWDIMPLHFVHPAAWAVQQIIEQTIPGSIIVLHDGHGHGRKVASIIDTIVPRLKATGYRFVKIEDMKRNRLHE